MKQIPSKDVKNAHLTVEEIQKVKYRNQDIWNY